MTTHSRDTTRNSPRNPLRGSHKDRGHAREVLDTPQTRSPAYSLAFDDQDFLCRPETRGVRLQLEMMKAELLLQEAGIVSTTVLFGGARIPAPGQDAWAAKNETQRKNLTEASRYYTEARTFAQLASLASAETDYTEHVVVTGGGPGVMEAGSRGAVDVGAPNIGLNIVLPFEQAPNAYVTPELAFNFHYFAIRKMHFLMRAASVAVFPGGFGTLDEFFETLTLIQTGRMERVPVLLFGRDFWNKAINIEALADAGTIGPDDHELFTIVDTAQEGWNIVAEHYGLAPGSVARTSNTPGRTQELNFFVPEGDFEGGIPPLALVDMPGYGFAKAPKDVVEQWTALVMTYLQGRPTLRRVFVLIDSRHGLKANDNAVLDLLDKAAMSYQLVLTKADKVKPPALVRLVEETTQAIVKRPAAFPEVLATSSEKGAGVDDLKAAIAYSIGA